MRREEKIISTSWQGWEIYSCLITFFKKKINTDTATGNAEAVTGGVL